MPIKRWDGPGEKERETEEKGEVGWLWAKMERRGKRGGPRNQPLHDFNAALTCFYVIITLISWKICAQMLYRPRNYEITEENICNFV